MKQFEKDAKAFVARRQEAASEARQLAALALSCGVDLQGALNAPRETRAALILKLRHAIERERQRGLHRHWAYDLNRHIALKQALDRLTALDRDGFPFNRQATVATYENGAQRRR